MTYIGNELFSVGGRNIDLSMNDFWRWSHSDLHSSMERSFLAKFIVASSLGIVKEDAVCIHDLRTPYDFLSSEGYRIDTKSAAYIQAKSAEHPEQVSFSIAPTRFPWDDASERLRKSDATVFCIYKAWSSDESPLNLDLWDFYILSTKALDEKMLSQKTITFPSLMQLKPAWCDYYGIGDAIQKIMTA